MIRQSEPLVMLDRVSMRYGRGPEILHNLTLTMGQGEFYFLTGASGAGKSSLLKLLYLAHRPHRGQMTLFGQAVQSLARPALAALRRQIGVVFQDYRLLDHLPLYDNVALPLRIAGDDERDIRHFVEELLAWVGLADYAGSMPSVLSGGQKQSAAIARAVIGRPKLLLADEPTGNLDQQQANRVLGLFSELNRNGATVVIATHNKEIIQAMGHSVLELQDGMILRGRTNQRHRMPPSNPRPSQHSQSHSHQFRG